ncbi:Serine/threonine protein phosphatase 2A 55 kDa regulatory subunit B beta isoform [Orobanche gracilis]
MEIFSGVRRADGRGRSAGSVDIISAIEFNKNGAHLATGDRGGRVVLFERTDTKEHGGLINTQSSVTKLNFRAMNLRFDYLKSLEIEEKINKIRWCQTANGALFLLSTNDKTIKFWKVQEKKIKKVSHINIDPFKAVGYIGIASSSVSSSPKPHLANGVCSVQPYTSLRNDLSFPPGGIPSLRLPVVTSSETSLVARCRRVYAHAHDYHINSISNNSDEVITSAEFHPTHCDMLAYSSSKGSIRLVDLRQSALCDSHSKLFEEQEAPGSRSFFTEIIASISDVKFARDGRYILSRDYMTLKLWDINMDSGPVSTFQVHEYLRPKLCDLYENDSIFDKFECCLSGDGLRVATGSYSNMFRIFERASGSTEATTLEASKNPISTFESIHTKKRNRLEHQRLNALVFVKYNFKLRERSIRRRDKIDPIVVDEIDSDDEWITEKEDPVLPEGSRWLENDELFLGDPIMTVPSDPFDSLLDSDKRVEEHVDREVEDLIMPSRKRVSEGSSRGKEKQLRVVRLVDEDVEIEEHVGVDPQNFDIATSPEIDTLDDDDSDIILDENDYY